MDASNIESRTLSAKKSMVGSPPKVTPAPSGPTTFFLKSEKELEKSTQQRGRKTSRSSVTSQDTSQTTPAGSLVNDSSFGVQSLEETISSAFPVEENLLSRTPSNSSERDSSLGDHMADADGADPSVILSRKRKAGNRVHPTIIATGHRILSSERVPQILPGASASPISSSRSPFRRSTIHRGSETSLVNMDNSPLTPIRLSPHPESVTPSTPRSGSPKSFRLSDEDSTDETNSQAIMSSSGDEEESQLERPPQLVMPSLSVPLRRPFTEQGMRIGRAKILVIGGKGVGKTSFINSLYRSNEHIVHMDQTASSILSHPTGAEASSDFGSPSMFTEVHASTRPYPKWWTDFENRRMLHGRNSMGEGVLERNLTFVDTSDLDDDDQVQAVLDHVKMTMRRTADMKTMNDVELIGLLSGEGGVQFDAVIYLFDPSPTQTSNPIHMGLTPAHQELLQCLCKWTNLIPVITHSDRVDAEALQLRKRQIRYMFELIHATTYSVADDNEVTTGEVLEPLAVSFATGEDSEIDASVLMSSQYLPPLVASELGTFAQRLLSPDNVAKMRHLSATKFLLWRQQNPCCHTDFDPQILLRSRSPGVTSNGSLLDDPSKVLVPFSSSSYYRSASPATSDISGNAADPQSSALAELSQQAQPSEPFRQVRLAKWAQDLQRSLANERRKYTQMYNNRPSEWSSESEKDDNQALVSTRPGRGRLGGDLGVIDPRDPLGVLAFGQSFRRQGVVVLQIVGSCGLIGAVAYWVVKNWAEVQGYLGISQQPNVMVTTPAVPPPTKPLIGWIDDNYVRGFFGWK